MSRFIKSLIEDIDADVVHSILDNAAKEDEVETITFGLETDDGSIVKVYVSIDDADDFEEELSNRIGRTDDIAEMLEELSTEYDIVDIKWPGDEEDTNDNEEDGSESLNPDVNYDDVKESYGKRFTNRILGEADIEVSTSKMDPKTQEFINRYGNTSFKKLGILLLISLGLDIKTLTFIKQKKPTFFRDLGIIIKDMGAANRNKVLAAFNISLNEDTSPVISWNINKSGQIVTLSNGNISIDFDLDTFTNIVEAIGEYSVIRVKDINDDKVIFSPRKNSYLLKYNDEEYFISKDDIDSILDVNLLEAKRVYARKGNKIVRKFRCTAGKRKGKLVKSAADCFKKKDLNRARKARISAKKTKYIRARKSKLTRRKATSKLIKRLNKGK